MPENGAPALLDGLVGRLLVELSTGDAPDSVMCAW